MLVLLVLEKRTKIGTCNRDCLANRQVNKRQPLFISMKIHAQVCLNKLFFYTAYRPFAGYLMPQNIFTFQDIFGNYKDVLRQFLLMKPQLGRRRGTAIPFPRVFGHKNITDLSLTGTRHSDVPIPRCYP